MPARFDIRSSAFKIPPRPYQVNAVQHMVKCIDNGNGTIWPTTGSGKTLTSFNASTLLSKLLGGELSILAIGNHVP